MQNIADRMASLISPLKDVHVVYADALKIVEELSYWWKVDFNGLGFVTIFSVWKRG